MKLAHSQDPEPDLAQLARQASCPPLGVPHVTVLQVNTCLERIVLTAIQATMRLLIVPLVPPVRPASTGFSQKALPFPLAATVPLGNSLLLEVPTALLVWRVSTRLMEALNVPLVKRASFPALVPAHARSVLAARLQLQEAHRVMESLP